MLALHAKRGVETTLERVFKSTGGEFSEMVFLWTGRTAGVSREVHDGKQKATFLMPSIEETAEISRDVYNQYIGFVLHELGHVWFTEDEPWDDARTTHGAWLGHLINGLEDPRIEQAVIDSGHAHNAGMLFERLINAMIEKDGGVKPTDFKNIPFMLAIEGRRLNGYRIDHPDLMVGNPWAHLLTPALQKAKSANSTEEIVRIAIDLFNKLKDDQSQPRPEPSESSQSGDQEQGDTQGRVSDESCLNGDMTGVKDVEPDSFIESQVPGTSNSSMPGVLPAVFVELIEG